jgi:excisionase family DNA binding protein
MISNRQIVDGIKDALFKAFKAWLDENRAEILKMTAEAGAAIVEGRRKPVPEPEPVPNPHLLTTAQVAERWKYHQESIRRLVCERVLSSVRLGQRVRVPLQEVERYEREGTLGRRL